MAFGRIGYIVLHPATFLILSTMGLIVAGGMLWRQHGAAPGSGSRSPLTAGQYSINGPGEWADAALAKQVCEQLAALSQPVDEPRAVDAIARALLQVGPIDRVRSVSKSRSGVRIEGVWREPVATVRVATGINRLVDRAGVALNRSVADGEADRWLRISINGPGGESLADWQTWGDSRVVAAAAIAGELGSAARELGLYRVVTFRLPDGLGPSSGSFELWTAAGAKVIWSDEGPAGDPALVARRLEALRRWVSANGPLDQLAGRMMLDLRSGSVNLIADRISARLPDEPVELK